MKDITYINKSTWDGLIFFGSLALEYRHYGFGNGPLEDEAYKFEVDNNRLVW